MSVRLPEKECPHNITEKEYNHDYKLHEKSSYKITNTQNDIKALSEGTDGHFLLPPFIKREV